MDYWNLVEQLGCVQDFFIQTMDIAEGDSGKFGFDPLDCTKVCFKYQGSFYSKSGEK